MPMPVLYVPAGQREPKQADLDAVRYIMRDVALVLLRKTGRRLAVSNVTVAHGPAVDVSVGLTYGDRSQWETVRQALWAAGTSIQDRIVLAFVLGNPVDSSGLGATARGVGVIDPHLGGLGLIGEGALFWGKKWRFTAPTTDARMEYGGSSILPVIHELGHTMGLGHPADIQSHETVMGYAYMAFAVGLPDVNPALFTDAELLTLQAHDALADVSWSAGPDVRLVPDKDVRDVLSGKVPAGAALVLGRFNRDYEVDAGGQP